MSKAQLVITAVVLEGRSKSEVARNYDVSRNWVQQLVKRYETEGAAAFEPHSRRPRRNPRAVDAVLEEHIVGLRKTLAKRRQSPCGGAHLAHPDPPRIRHTPAPETTPLIIETLRGRPAQTNAGKPTSPTGAWPITATSKSLAPTNQSRPCHPQTVAGCSMGPGEAEGLE
jgi:transposase-like protein